MGANNEMKQAEAAFHAVIQEMLESINLPEKRFKPVSDRLNDVWLIYVQQLIDASKSSQDEVSEHYRVLAGHIPLQAGFFITALQDYRKSRGLGPAG